MQGARRGPGRCQPSAKTASGTHMDEPGIPMQASPPDAERRSSNQPRWVGGAGAAACTRTDRMRYLYQCACVAHMRAYSPPAATS